ncbi:hypothetical protein [Brachybacterium sp. GU-2]|uniref:hypothetical protein n=1 Tax=Brachybacterium sp. GU-2 TaxID=3069708 RepID=UPI00280B363B|nr:hypothetical protein [Brachybacterium sp. GU-2]WME22615.1 hypothetical protein RBL05_13930 [Brachybacterium sp. GU-2]
MSSAHVADRVHHASLDAAVDDLLVLWQHPESRQIHPIGRFSFDGEVYTFSYTRRAHQIPDFRPLPGLPLDGVPYCSTRMPTLFQQRTMSPRRPDFDLAMQHLGIAPREATPWEQIVHSGGHRAGDTLQFMEMPTVADGHVRARFLTNGIRYIPNGSIRMLGGEPVQVTEGEHESALSTLAPGDDLDLSLETSNPKDPDAVVVTFSDVPLGWVPRILSTGVRALVESARYVRASVHRVAGPSAPPHVRLVVDLEGEAPAGFTFDTTGEWEPYRS